MSHDDIICLIISLCRSYEARTGLAPTHVRLGAREHEDFMDWCGSELSVAGSPRDKRMMLAGVEILPGDMARGITLEVREIVS